MKFASLLVLFQLQTALVSLVHLFDRLALTLLGFDRDEPSRETLRHDRMVLTIPVRLVVGLRLECLIDVLLVPTFGVRVAEFSRRLFRVQLRCAVERPRELALHLCSCLLRLNQIHLLVALVQLELVLPGLIR